MTSSNFFQFTFAKAVIVIFYMDVLLLAMQKLLCIYEKLFYFTCVVET